MGRGDLAGDEGGQPNRDGPLPFESATEGLRHARLLQLEEDHPA